MREGSTKILIKNDPSAFPDARAEVVAFLVGAEIPRPSIDDVETIIAEVLDNISEHGKTPKSITLRVSIDTESMVLEFRDGGPEFDPTARPSALENESAVGGMGLLLVSQLADVIHYHRSESGENVFTVTKHLN